MQQQDGYVIDTDYPPHFYPEMQPELLLMVAALQGVKSSALNGVFSYCELGCGLGINLLVAAAKYPQAIFVGVDFNAQHIRKAQQAAAELGLSNVQFIEADFKRFSRLVSQSFDYIVCHGVWSWIATEQQQAIIQIVRKSLVPNGILYLHYMSMPGATYLIPIQKFLNEYARGYVGSSSAAVTEALRLLHEMAKANIFSIDTIKHLEVLATKHPAYLAHEFISDYWRPLFSIDLHRELNSNAQMTFIGSANVFNNMPELSVPGMVQQILHGVKDVAVLEYGNDIARNSHQRQDLFQKNPNRLSATEQLVLLERFYFALSANAPRNGAVTFATDIGDIPGPEELIAPLLRMLAKPNCRFSDLANIDIYRGQIGLLLQALQLLINAGYVIPLLTVAAGSQQRIQHLNAWLQRNQLDLVIVG